MDTNNMGPSYFGFYGIHSVVLDRNEHGRFIGESITVKLFQAGLL